MEHLEYQPSATSWGSLLLIVSVMAADTDSLAKRIQFITFMSCGNPPKAQRAQCRLWLIRKWATFRSNLKSIESMDLSWESSEVICSCKPDASRASVLLRSRVICPFRVLTFPSIYVYAGSTRSLSVIILNSYACIVNYTSNCQACTHRLTKYT